MTFEEMKAFLASGGVDVKTFDARGAKSLRDLHSEIVSKEVVLSIEGGRVCRVALTTNILILISSTLEYIRQIKRVYPSGKEVVRGGVVSISETRIRGELELDTVKRGLMEECGISVSDSQIRMPLAEDYLYVETDTRFVKSQNIDTHESSVYPDVQTLNHFNLYVVHLPDRPWPEDVRVINDNGVLIHLEYARFEVPQKFEKLLSAL